MCRRFQAHSSFVMLCFSALRLCRSSIGTSVMTKRDDWIQTKCLLANITDEEVSESMAKAEKFEKITNTAIKLLMSKLACVGRIAKGSDSARNNMLNELKSLIVLSALAFLYITLNPGDRDSPLCLFYAGEKIDIECFDPAVYPIVDRLKKLMENPEAVVEYFHNTVQVFLRECIDGGMFGEVAHWYGTIEYQNRGAPHIHMLV